MSVVLGLVIGGCSSPPDERQETPSPSLTPTPLLDGDGDGFTVAQGDCDDGDAAISPQSPEICDGVDNNCDGDADPHTAQGALTFYLDADDDGFGDAATSLTACEAPEGYVAQAGDCLDSDAAVSPGAAEICDAADVDEDCDGMADDADDSVDLQTGTIFYPDTDLDGFGAQGSEGALACDARPGRAAVDTDCDDASPRVNPDGREVCDPENIDEDCDGVADDADDSAADGGKVLSWGDADHDGYGAADAQGVALCDPEVGAALVGGDCDDAAAAVHPGAQEVCDAGDVDEDCDGRADDDDASVAAEGKARWYGDGDGDGYGAGPGALACDPSEAAPVATAGDCDDSDAAVNPAAAEVCNGVDDDCDGRADDEAQGAPAWYRDDDGDGFGAIGGEAVTACEPPPGYVSAAGDCDDAAPAVNPGAVEVCDAADVDEDCSGAADDLDAGADPASKLIYYYDGDDDQYGDAADPGSPYCDPPADYVLSPGDCDDTSPFYNPSAPERCDDPEDYNCDGSVGYADQDGDGYAACEDCNDADAAISPGASEVCDAHQTDENCNLLADDQDAFTLAASKLRFYVDSDGDGYGDEDGASRLACLPPSGYALAVGDCDDDNPAISPGAPEVCDSANVDEDCDGRADDRDDDALQSTQATYYADVDGDGFGDDGVWGRFCDDPSGDGAAWSSVGGDCDDAQAQVNPDSDEICNGGVDDNCDGSADGSDASDALSFYADKDSDGYGDAFAQVLACRRPAGHVPAGEGFDCDDGAATVNPGALEVCDPAHTDENCNGLEGDDDPTTASLSKTRAYPDGDDDGYGSGEGELYCDVPPDAALVAQGGDCDDGDANINPGAEEACTDEVDLNCDGATGFVDADGDGSAACIDCDDNDPAVSPRAREICDPANRDENCNGLADNDDPTVDPATEITWYPDADQDGVGALTGSLRACDDPSAQTLYVDSTGDCDDADSGRYPGAPERCDAGDNDCDDAVDEDPEAAPLFYLDDDGDGYGLAYEAQRACTPPEGYAAQSGDCDDDDGDVHPGQAEVCALGGIDTDCDGPAGCTDADCQGDEACILAEICDSGDDEDGDGLTDCDDDDCAGQGSCAPPPCPAADLGQALGPAVALGSTDGLPSSLGGACGGASASEATFAWVAPATGQYTLSTVGSTLDTVLSLREGGCDGSELACNDDRSDGDTGPSEIVVDLVEGQALTIVVDGYGTDAGAFELSIQLEEATPTPEATPTQGPPDCPSAHTTGDDYEPDECSALAADLIAGQPQERSLSPVGDIDWGRFTAEAGHMITLQANGNIGLRMDLYDADATTLIVTSNASSGRPAISRMITRSGTYYAKLRAYYSGATGIYTLSLDDLGPNDHGQSLAEATVVSTDSTVLTGELEIPSNKDHFAFDAQAGRAYQIHVQPLATTGIDLRLYGPDAATLMETRTTSYTTRATIDRDDLGTDRYFFTVERDYGSASTGAYEVWVVDLGPWDHGSDAATATLLSTDGVAVSGRFEVGGNTDHFAFDAIGGHLYQLWAQPDAATGLEMRLYDLDGALLEQRSASYSSTVLMDRGDLVDGRYHVTLRPDYGSASTGGYEIWAVDLGPNDHGTGVDDATWLSTDGQVLEGAFEVGGNTDHFRFEAAPGHFYQITARALDSTGIDLRLYDATGDDLIEVSEASYSGAAFIDRGDLTDGVYTLTVRPDYGSRATGAYEIDVVDLGLNDHGSAPEDATAIQADGLAVAGSFEVGGNVDYFTFEATTGHLYRITAQALSSTGTDLRLYDQDAATLMERSEASYNNTALIDRGDLQTGWYTLAVRPDYGSASVGDYSLIVTDLGPNDHGDGPSTATAILTDGSVTSGLFEVGGNRDTFSFAAGADVAYRISARSQSNTGMDLRLYDTDGSTRLALDDESYNTTAVLTLDAGPAGTYFFTCEPDYGSASTGAYEVWVEALP